MARKKKTFPILEHVEITDFAAEGKSIARITTPAHDGLGESQLVVFVPWAVPGDIVDLQIRRKKHSYAEAEIVRFHQKSPLRIEPRCRHFGVCGGCKWQQLPYEEQLKFKQKQVYDQLTRIGHLTLPLPGTTSADGTCQFHTIMGSVHQYEYRNKLDFGAANKRYLTKEEIENLPPATTIAGDEGDVRESAKNVPALGFHITGAFDKILPIEQCHLMHPLHNDIRNAVRDYALQNGINVIKVSNKGNGYINYYTTSWKTAPKVKMHFLNAKEQGYFSPKYKGHTNDDWKRLLANAKGDCLDMHGEFTDCVFPVSSFKANCPNDGEWLMAIYDSIISVERDIMGIFKYKHEFPNRQCAITVATSGGLYHASNDGFCVPVNALRDPTSRTHYDIWGAAHEYGHQNQTQGLRWIGLTEVTNNIMSAYVEHKLRTDGYHRLENESNGFRYYDFFEYNVMKGGQFVPHAHNDVFCTLVPFWQLLIYTRIAGIQPDAYPELYETLRNQSALSSMSDGQHQVNFMKQWCHITKTNFLPYFKQVGMFKTVDESISDYSTRQLTITQAMLDNLEKEINAANYPEPPAAFCYIDVNNYPAFRDKAALVANTVGKGCSVSGNTVRIQHNQWKNVVGFETYKADGTLLHMTNYGHGDSAYKPTMTSVVWNTSEKPAYIMAVGYDGTRVKCYEP
jgi:predicted RNA-binding protein with TRAM domain